MGEIGGVAVAGSGVAVAVGVDDGVGVGSRVAMGSRVGVAVGGEEETSHRVTRMATRGVTNRLGGDASGVGEDATGVNRAHPQINGYTMTTAKLARAIKRE